MFLKKSLKTGFSSVVTEQSKQQGLCWTIKYILNCLGNLSQQEREREICLKLNPWLTSVWPQRQKWKRIHCLCSHTHKSMSGYIYNVHDSIQVSYKLFI